MKSAKLALVGLVFLGACSSQPHTAATFNSTGVIPVSSGCSALGFTPGSTQYDDCLENERVRQDIVARKAFNGNKNQPDGVMAQTYSKRMSVMINCTSYSTHTGGPSLCD